MPKLLIIDDNEGVRDALELLFDVNGLDVATAADPEAGVEIVRTGTIDLVIQDMNFSSDTTSGEEGVALFRELRELDPDLPIILLTAWTHLEQAVELVKSGAADYLSKPWDDVRLLTTVRNLLDLRAEKRANRERREKFDSSRRALAEKFDLCGIVYASEAMHQVLTIATRVARADVPVLITGPNGSGKQKVAEVIQANSSVRSGPFVTVNAGALPENLIEAELFGAEAGAYTGANKAREGRFEAADGGTLFLDEMGNLPPEGQMKLLRVLQTGEFERLGSSKTRKVHVRVISATNTDLDRAVAEGRFREDLYYRLNVIPIDIPPLATRPADILPLAAHFLADGYRFSPAAERALTAHDWPGNVRELENMVRRAVLLADTSTIQPSDLGLEASDMDDEGPGAEDIRQALEDADGVIAKAARALNLSRQALYRRMEKHGIDK
ncbi:MAG: sigma-54 dependent transcriptional regulator [Xanthomonadales bacterium]|nr:sigma-54 dependent transcriptional regulator [Xanthomonadales bacterium]